MKRYCSRTRDETVAANDLRLELAGASADLRAFDIVLGQVAVDLRITAIPVIAPAGREEEVHDVQPEAGPAGAGLFVQETLPFNAADVSALPDPRLHRIGVDLDEVVVCLTRISAPHAGISNKERRRPPTQRISVGISFHKFSPVFRGAGS